MIILTGLQADQQSVRTNHDFFSVIYLETHLYEKRIVVENLVEVPLLMLQAVQ